MFIRLFRILQLELNKQTKQQVVPQTVTQRLVQPEPRPPRSSHLDSPRGQRAVGITH